MTSQGHPHALFRRAIERGNLVVAETTAREIGQINLVDALELTALVAQKEPHRLRRVAGRWLQRYMAEAKTTPTLDDVGVAVISLGALGGARHDEALVTLRALAGARPGGRR